MDYGAIVKEAWRVTWRYKILWLFGLFAGASSGSNSRISNSSSDFGNGSQWSTDITNAADSMTRWAEQNIGLLIAIAVFAVLIGIVFWVISVAARGGLIRLVDDAEESREVRAGNGWSAGFGAWGRLFLVRLVLFLPFVLIVLAIIAVTLVPVIIGNSGGDAALAPALFGMCGVLFVVGMAAFVIGVVITLIDEFAERHIVLSGLRTFESISAGWQDFKVHFKDTLLMWLITLVIGIAFAIVFVIALLIIGVGAFVSFIAAGICGGAVAALLLLGLFLLPSAIYATFMSAIWTIFWRRLRGKGIPQQAMPAPVAQAPVIPPTPPAAP